MLPRCCLLHTVVTLLSVSPHVSARVKGVRVASAPPWPQEMPGLGWSENQESGMSGQGLGPGLGAGRGLR